MGASGLRKPMKPVSPVDPPEDDLVVTILTRMGDWMILHAEQVYPLLGLTFLLVIAIPGGLPVNILIIAVCVYLVLWWLWRSLLREED
jgi:hypothetical protein